MILNYVKKIGSFVPVFYLGIIFALAGAYEAHGSTNSMISKESNSLNAPVRIDFAPDCPVAGPTVSLEYLYWKVDAELYVGSLFDYMVDNAGNVTIKDTLQRQRFDFTSGFRVGLGYDLPYEHYDVSLTWAWLQPKTTKNLVTKPLPPSGVEIAVALSIASETGEDIAGSVGSLSSKWRMKFNMFDLQMGRKFFVGKRFSLRPNLGLKGGWINHTQAFSFNDVPLKDNSGNHLPDTQGSGKKTNKFEGIGPLFGIDMRYGFGPQFGLFGNLSGALLYGRFHLSNMSFLGNTSDLVPKTIIFQNSHSRLSSTVQMLIGGDWSRCLYQKWWIHFGAAYEVQMWMDQLGANDSPDQVQVVTYRSGGDLMMHGLTLQTKFDF